MVHGVSFGAGVQHAVSRDTTVQLRVQSGTGVSAGWEYKRRGIKLSVAAHRALAALPAVMGGAAASSGARRHSDADATSPVSVNVQLQLNGDALSTLFARRKPPAAVAS